MLFDRFIVVDWSARSSPSPAKPTKDAIWLANAEVASGEVTTLYFRTRAACYAYLYSALRQAVARQERTLLGLDVIYAYPAGFAKALGLKKNPPWKAIWELLSDLVKDDENNHNNRFEVGGDLNRRCRATLGPFWGVPAGQSGIFLGAKKDFDYPVVAKKAILAEKRRVEARCIGMQAAWKLAYTGSVGSQGLTAIPYLHQLRFGDEILAKHSQVWPFETGFTQQPLADKDTFILHAEIWPSLVKRPGEDSIPDREQVRSVAHWLMQQQAAEKLLPLFDVPKKLGKKDRKICEREEGWVLGV